MSNTLRYDGKVVIITGAGNGLGRSHALMFGARGAKVVVNDLGGGIHGGGQSSAAADKVVEEIKALGGEAVANYDSVENGPAIVKTALDAFGTVDIVVNNAGILRDVSFQKMTMDDWNLIHKVHLYGSMSVTHAAWPILREKGYGRVIFTTSGAGIYGNFGQANYSSAKLGLHGLAQTLAIEGRSKNILVNTIGPIAGSRLTETIMPPEMIAALKPEYVSPLVGWLCHESCEETSGLFEVGAGYFSKLRWERTRGHVFGNGRAITPDDIAARWSKITDFTDAEHPKSVDATFGAINAAINATSLGGNEFIDLDTASKQERSITTQYDEKDLALYAIGVGAGSDPADRRDLSFSYMLNDGFSALPTWTVIQPTAETVKSLQSDNGGLPGLNYGFDRVLHGEQYTEIRAPLPKAAKVRHTYKLKAAYDKKPHALVVMGITTTDEASGEELAYNEFTTFVRNAGGWGGERGPSADINVPPAREPDLVVEEKIGIDQGLLFGLSGDTNPLHADPDFARSFGYDKPILQGLCTYGYVGRAILKACCGNDPLRFKSIKVRFADPVYPGETLLTRIWKESPTRVVFEVKVKERDKVVIKNAAAEILEQPMQRKAKPVAAKPAADVLLPEDVFATVAAFVGEKPEIVAKAQTTFQFKLKNPGSDWLLDLKNGKGEARQGALDKPDVTIELDADLLPTVMTSSIKEIQKLYFGGKLKIGGNLAASNKLEAVLGIAKARYEAQKAQRLGQK